MALTYKQKNFCIEYIKKNYNATAAYLAAYDTNNIDTAHPCASKLLKNPEIIEYIEELRKEALEQAHIDITRITMRLADIAFNADGQTSKKDSLKAIELLLKVSTNLPKPEEKIYISIDEGGNK